MSRAHFNGATRLPPDTLLLTPKSYTVVPHRVPTLLMKLLKDVEHVELQYSPRNVLLKGTSLLSSPGQMNRGPQATSVDNAALHGAGTVDGTDAGLGKSLILITEFEKSPRMNNNRRIVPGVERIIVLPKAVGLNIVYTEEVLKRKRIQCAITHYNASDESQSAQWDGWTRLECFMHEEGLPDRERTQSLFLALIYHTGHRLSLCFVEYWVSTKTSGGIRYLQMQHAVVFRIISS